MFYKKLIETLKNTINNLEKEIADLKLKIEQRDLMLKDYQEEHVILLNNASELRAKIVDLENNIELLTNCLRDIFSSVILVSLLTVKQLEIALTSIPIIYQTKIKN